MSRRNYPRDSFILFLCIACGFFGLAYIESAHGKTLQVVTTTSDLASITRSIAGEHAEVKSIANGKRDPHFLQAKPACIMMARNADLWIRVGMELEIGWEQPIIDGSRNSKIREGAPGHLDASGSVRRIDVPDTLVSRGMGDVHPMGNPHYWLDPLNGRIVAETIADRLVKLDPAHAETYRENLRRFTDLLDRRMFGDQLVKTTDGDRLWSLYLDNALEGYLQAHPEAGTLGGWLKRMRPWQGEPVVIYHRSWNYFLERFGLPVAAELEPKPGIPPSAAHLADVVQIVKDRGVKVLLVEPFYDKKAADRVADRTGAETIVCTNSVGGQPEATDYPALIDLIVARISGALAKGN